jgi:hypothetical protein
MQRLNCVSRHFLRQARQVLGLLGERLKLLAPVRGRQFKKVGRRFHAGQLLGKVEGGVRGFVN